jgi:hypothetical protein
MILEGRAAEADGDLLEVMKELRLPAKPIRGRQRPSQALAELRAHER